jgi:hypothetical protein
MTRLHREIDELKKSTARDEGKVKEVEEDYNHYKEVESINPTFAQVVVQTLTKHQSGSPPNWRKAKVCCLYQLSQI